MENVQNSWSTVTQGIYKAVLIYVCCGIASSIFAAFGSAGNATDLLAGDMAGAASWGFWDILVLIATIGAIVGYYLFYTGLNKWRVLVDSNDTVAVNRLRLAVLLTMIGCVLTYIPAVGAIASTILSLISLVLMILGYSALKQSATLREGAREGAGKLYTAQILSIIAVVIVWIPVVGWIAAPILSIVAFCKMLAGWKAIANS